MSFQKDKKMLSFLKYLFQLIISPARGWEDVSHAGTPYDELTSRGLYPLLGVAAISVFVSAFYNHDLTFIRLLQGAIIIFVKFFITYFIAVALFSLAAPKMSDGELNEKKGHTFIIYNIGLLALYNIIENILPIQLSFVQFLPLYSAIIIWKGARYLAIREDSMLQFTLFGIFSIIVPPYLISWIFNSIIPS